MSSSTKPTWPADVVVLPVRSLAQYTVALVMCERWREYLVLTLYIPLFGLYRIISKLVRIAATLQEFFLRWSYYRDPFAPPKVRKQMEVF